MLDTVNYYSKRNAKKARGNPNGWHSNNFIANYNKEIERKKRALKKLKKFIQRDIIPLLKQHDLTTINLKTCIGDDCYTTQINLKTSIILEVK